MFEIQPGKKLTHWGKRADGGRGELPKLDINMTRTQSNDGGQRGMIQLELGSDHPYELVLPRRTMPLSIGALITLFSTRSK